MKGIVTKVNRNNFNVMTTQEEVCRISNKLKETITVGDMVEVENKIITKLYERKSVLKRKGITKKPSEQLIAANIDLIYICMSANNDFNITKLNNYINVANGANVEVRLLLTKVDLTNDLEYYIKQVKIPVTPVSIYSDISHVIKEITGKTVCLIGSSGVGKSSIISKLIDVDLETKAIREYDSQGRHTTTARTMYMMKDYNIIDLPGMRIVYASEDDFSEIEEAALLCKFRNCKHITEPQCNVKKMVAEGKISELLLNKFYKQ